MMMNSIRDPSSDHTSSPGRSQRIGGQTLTGVQRFVPQHFGWVSARWDERLEKRLARRISRWFSYRLQMPGTNKRGKENNNSSKLNAKQEQPPHEYYMSLWIPNMLLRCYCREKQKRRWVFFRLVQQLFRIQHDSVAIQVSIKVLFAENMHFVLVDFWRLGDVYSEIECLCSALMPNLCTGQFPPFLPRTQIRPDPVCTPCRRCRLRTMSPGRKFHIRLLQNKLKCSF